MTAARGRRRLDRRARNAWFKLTRWALRRRGMRHLRRLQDEFQREIGARGLAESFVSRHGSTVQRGPFAGLRYPATSARRVNHLVPKLLGSYERELHPAICRALAARPSHFINVGCADGYYAVGFALAAPQGAVRAFDVDPVARRLCRRLASSNGVARRVAVGGDCHSETLRRLPLAGAFLLSDCEGGEVELFSAETVALMGATTVLVELHEVTGEGHVLHAEERILARFDATHHAELFASEPRDPADYRELADLDLQARDLALDELRPGPMKWAFFTPKAG
jgi:precorrin-6B methylase 2